MKNKRYALAVLPLADSDEFGYTDDFGVNRLSGLEWVRRSDLVLVQDGENWRVVKSRYTVGQAQPLDFLDMIYKLAEAFGVDLSEPPSEKAARNLEKSQIVAETPAP